MTSNEFHVQVVYRAKGNQGRPLSLYVENTSIRLFFYNGSVTRSNVVNTGIDNPIHLSYDAPTLLLSYVKE